MILIVYAHEPEVGSLRQLISETPLDSMVRWRRFRTTSDRLLNLGEQKPEMIVNVGYAGRLNPELKLGEVVLVEKIGSGAGEERLIALPESMTRHAADRGMRRVSLTTSNEPVLDETTRIALQKATGADIVDMEAAFAAGQAAAASVPFASIKLVSDGADANSWENIKRRQAEWALLLGRAAHDLLSASVETAAREPVGR